MSATEADAKKGVLIELNIPRPLHWEVQIFGDGDTVVHFAARDCSWQNHGYQKFIELACIPPLLPRKYNGSTHTMRPRAAVLAASHARAYLHRGAASRPGGASARRGDR